MSNQERKSYQALRKELGLDYRKLAEITGLTYESVKSLCAPAKPTPTWLKTAVWVYEEMNKSSNSA